MFKTTRGFADFGNFCTRMGSIDPVTHADHGYSRSTRQLSTSR